jgi:chemotaxis response regulator CheB
LRVAASARVRVPKPAGSTGSPQPVSMNGSREGPAIQDEGASSAAQTRSASGFAPRGPEVERVQPGLVSSMPAAGATFGRAGRSMRPLAGAPLTTGLRFHPETLLAIGASTGGTEAIHDVLVELPVETPGIVITQHIPKLFSGPFAQRLNRACAIEVREALDGDEIRPGLALVAPGDVHMLVRRVGGRYVVQLQDGPKVCYQRPAVDVMFASVASAAKANAVGALLTGMGADGAQGLLAMKKAGASTMAQDEATCVVYGMPREAFRMGATQRVLPLSSIASALLREAASKAASQ